MLNSNSPQTELARGMQTMRPPFLKAIDYSETDFQNASQKSHFLELRMPIVFKCNLKCIYCNQNALFVDEEQNIKKKATTSTYPPLTTHERISLIEQVAEIGAKTVVLSGAGETTLSDDLLEIITAIRSNGLNCLVVSNLIPINEELGEKLYDMGVNVMGKLNTINPELQAGMVGLNNAYEVFFKKIMMMLKLGFTNYNRFSMNTVICKDNYNEILSLFVFCRENNIIPWIEKMTFEGRAEQEDDISSEDTIKLFEKIALLDRVIYGYEWDAVPPLIACPTYERYKYLFTIDMFGNAFPTNATQTYIAGNVRKQPLLEIYRSEQFQNTLKIDKHFQKR